MTRVLVLLSLLLAATGASAVEPNIIRYRLDNGLEVVLAPDSRVPKFAFQLRYRVGSMSEPPGRSGFAHLFEHLMFSGTPAHPNIDVAYGALGLDLNAWTNEDYTLYYAEGPASALPFVLSVEADRMANQGAAITQEDLDIQRGVVLNEMRENVLDTVGQAGWEAIITHLYPAPHPYHRAVIGSIADLGEATIEDVHGFFDTYYAPNNAILVLAGDFDPERVRGFVAETFGRVARGPELPVPVAGPPPVAGGRIELEDRLPTPTLVFGWALPAVTAAGPDAEDIGALRIAAELLSNSDYGVLRRTLLEQGYANDAYASLQKGQLGSRFFIDVTVADGVDAADTERALRAAVAAFVAEPPDAGDVERARRTILLDDRLTVEPLAARAELIAHFAALVDNPAAALVDDPDVAAADPERVRVAAARWLVDGNETVLLIRPGDRGGYPDVLTSATGTPPPFAAEPRPHTDIPVLEPGEPLLGELPERQTARLRNGIEVVHYQLPGAPMAHLAIRSPAGIRSDPEGKEGLVELAVAMALRGAGDRDIAAFGRAGEDVGARFDWWPQDLSSFITAAAPPEGFAVTVDLLADAVRRPAFNPDEWTMAKSDTLDWLARREGDLVDVAARAGHAAILPKRPGEPAPDLTLASVRSISLADAAEAFPRIFSPATASFYSVGPLPLDAVVAELDRAFGDWSSAIEPLPAGDRGPAVFPESVRVLLAPEPGASQAAIFIARPGPGFSDPERAEAVAISRILGDDFLSRINRVIREEKGLSYGTSGSLLGAMRRGSALVIETTVERDNTGEALSDMLAGFAGLTDEPVTDEEVRRSVTAFQAMIAGTTETAGGFFDLVWGELGEGTTVEEEFDRRLAMTRIDPDAVRRTGMALSALDRAVIVVAGDPGVILPQLEAIGFASVEVIDRDLP